MLMRKIKYTDYNGNETEERFYFNLTKSEITEWEHSVDGGMGEKLQMIAEAQKVGPIVGVLREILLKAYGEKSPDGRHFMKSKDISDRFYNSPAYDILFMEFAQDAGKFAEFVKSIMPADIQKEGTSDAAVDGT